MPTGAGARPGEAAPARTVRRPMGRETPPALRLPVMVLAVAAAAALMLVVAAVASAGDQDGVARAFLYASLLIGVVTGLAAIASQSLPRASGPATSLVALIAVYAFLPIVLAIPFASAQPGIAFATAYHEMLSCLTTTGASYVDPAELVPALHLWRGMVGWIGGLMTWVTAIAILAPLDLGGFEVSSEAQLRGETIAASGEMRAADPQLRLLRTLARLAPIYGGLTAALWLLLVMLGEAPTAAAVHAMSTLATSGISATGGDLGGVGPEIAALAFLFFALSRRTFLSGLGAAFLERMGRDREVRLGLVAILAVTALLFLRHWIGALEEDEIGDPVAAAQALWGNLFTAASFLTTTGFVSGEWEAARIWSGLSSPGLVLAGLCLMGGGVATTAGGMKLLRVYALYKHGKRELEKLVHPHSVASAGRLGRRIRREGAYIAWIFFMLFVLSLAAVMTLLALAGQDFEPALVLGISALTTTGPLAVAALPEGFSYAGLGEAARAVLSVAMVLGRVELLVLIAMLAPSFWRA